MKNLVNMNQCINEFYLNPFLLTTFLYLFHAILGNFSIFFMSMKISLRAIKILVGG